MPVEDVNSAERLSDFLVQLKLPLAIEHVRRSITDYFSSEDADLILSMAANKTVNQAREDTFTPEVTDNAWRWLSTSKNIRDILKFGLQELRRYLRKK